MPNDSRKMREIRGMENIYVVTFDSLETQTEQAGSLVHHTREEALAAMARIKPSFPNHAMRVRKYIREDVVAKIENP